MLELPTGLLEVIRLPVSLEGEVDGSSLPPQAARARVIATTSTMQIRGRRVEDGIFMNNTSVRFRNVGTGPTLSAE